MNKPLERQSYQRSLKKKQCLTRPVPRKGIDFSQKEVPDPEGFMVNFSKHWRKDNPTALYTLLGTLCGGNISHCIAWGPYCPASKHRNTRKPQTKIPHALRFRHGLTGLSTTGKGVYVDRLVIPFCRPTTFFLTWHISRLFYWICV